jgi:hypothetical protein
METERGVIPRSFIGEVVVNQGLAYTVPAAVSSFRGSFARVVGILVRPE